MQYLLISVAILAAVLLIANLLPENTKEKKPPSGNCRNCPELRYCGGGRRGCGRRGEIGKK